MLEIKNLHAEIEKKEIIKNLNLSIKKGEIHAIMGPNGSGKSTLAKVLAGIDVVITSGTITFCQQDLTTLTIEERARAGIFLGFQYPAEITGITNIFFLKTALNNIRKYQNLPELGASDFMQLLKEKMQILKLPENLVTRSINEGFSGGEKKRNEILQLLMFEPKLIILDEIDSGLDIDALKIICTALNVYQKEHPDCAIILITHYQRLLNYITPHKVHIFANGKIIRTGNLELAEKLEQHGYKNFLLDK